MLKLIKKRLNEAEAAKPKKTQQINNTAVQLDINEMDIMRDDLDTRGSPRQACGKEIQHNYHAKMRLKNEVFPKVMQSIEKVRISS